MRDGVCEWCLRRQRSQFPASFEEWAWTQDRKLAKREREAPWWIRWFYRYQRRSLRDALAEQMKMSFPPLDCLRCPEWDEEVKDGRD